MDANVGMGILTRGKIVTIIEHHLLSNYCTSRHYDSEIVPGAKPHYRVFNCPICKAEQPEPIHGVEGACRAKCGLSWRAAGNILTLKFDPPKQTVMRKVAMLLKGEN